MLVALIPNHSSLCWLVSPLQWSVSPAFNEWLCCLSVQPALSQCFIADHLLIWQAPKHSPFGSQDPHFGWKSNHSPLSLDSQNYFWGTYMHWGNAPHRIRNIRADTVMSHTTPAFLIWSWDFALWEPRTLSQKWRVEQNRELSLTTFGSWGT